MAVITFSGVSIHLPLTVIIVLANLRVAARTADGISDMDVVREDYDEEEKKNHLP